MGHDAGFFHLFCSKWGKQRQFSEYEMFIPRSGMEKNENVVAGSI